MGQKFANAVHVVRVCLVSPGRPTARRDSALALWSKVLLLNTLHAAFQRVRAAMVALRLHFLES